MSSRMRRCAQLAFSSSQQASSSTSSSSVSTSPYPERTNEDFFRNYDPMVGVGTAAILCAFIFLVTIKSFLKWLTRKFRMFRLMHSSHHRRRNSRDIEATTAIVYNTNTEAESTANNGGGGSGNATDSTSATTTCSPLKFQDRNKPLRGRGPITTIKPIIRDTTKVAGMSTSVPVLGGTVTNLDKSVVLETRKLKVPDGNGHLINT